MGYTAESGTLTGMAGIDDDGVILDLSNITELLEIGAAEFVATLRRALNITRPWR